MLLPDCSADLKNKNCRSGRNPFRLFNARRHLVTVPRQAMALRPHAAARRYPFSRVSLATHPRQRDPPTLATSFSEHASHHASQRRQGERRSTLFSFFLFFVHFYSPASGQAVVTGAIPSSPRFLPSTFIAHRVQQSHCSPIFHLVLLTHALALSASQFVHRQKSHRICTSMHSVRLDLTKLTYSRLEDNVTSYATGATVFPSPNPLRYITSVYYRVFRLLYILGAYHGGASLHGSAVGAFVLSVSCRTDGRLVCLSQLFSLR